MGCSGCEIWRQVKISRNENGATDSTSFTAYGVYVDQRYVSGRNFYLQTLYTAR